MTGVFDFMKHYCVCAGNVVYLAMRTRAGVEVNSFPVTVYNVNSQALSVAYDKDEFITIWNNNAANQAVGVLSGLLGPFSFTLTLNPGPSIPAYVIGEPETVGMNLVVDINGDILVDSNGDYLLFQ